MKCSKCGNEYEGNSCPKCNGPHIIVNDNDYLRRKKEWEENGRILGVPINREDTQKNQEDKDEFVLPKLPNVDLKKVKEKVKDKVITKVHINSIPNENGTNEKSSIMNRLFGLKQIQKLKDYWLKLVIILIIINILILSVVGIYNLYKRMNMTLYIVGTDGRICTGGALENKLIGNVSDVIFSLDGKDFFEQKLPSDFNGLTAIYSYASKDGSYFVTEVYDNKYTYTLYLWNKNHVSKIMESSNQKEVKYVTDHGKLLFTDISYLSEGTVSNIALYTYDAEGGADSNGLLTMIEKNIRSEYLYLKNNTLVYLNSSNKLYTMNFSKLNNKILICEDVKDIYGISASTDNLYSNSTDTVKPSDRDESFIYSQDGDYFYYNIEDKSSTYLFNSPLSGVEIIYEKSQNEVYSISLSSISFGIVKKESGATLTLLDNISSAADKCYYDSDTLVYVNKNGDLISVTNKDTKEFIRGGVSSGSLNLVRDSDGITYIADGVQYFRSSLKAKEIKLQNLSAGNDTSQTLVYKKYIYFMNGEGQLCSCTLKGKDLNTFGPATSYWVK